MADQKTISEEMPTAEDHIEIARHALREARALFDAIDHAAHAGDTVSPCVGSLAEIGSRICAEAFGQTDSIQRQ